jgi:hypothetical protein
MKSSYLYHQEVFLDGGDMKISYQHHQETYLDGRDMKVHINTIKKHVS